MPLPQRNWDVIQGNLLIFEELDYDRAQLENFVSAGVATLNHDQRMVYDKVTESCNLGDGIPYFVHSAGGCGKTYVFNLIAAAVRATGKIVLCVASSGIASLLLTGGRTAHSRFKIPIPCHEDSTCNIKKNDVLHQLLKRTTLIIWDEVPMQHRHTLECVDRSLRDLLDVDDDFGGITMLFGGDFRQTLPVVPHGSREQVVGASLVRSRI